MEGRVTISLDLAFRLLEQTRIVTCYLDPPEDWKPWKFDSPEVYAGEIALTHKQLLKEMAEDMGVDIGE